MARKTFEQAERHGLEILAVAVVGILFWIGLWGITDEGISYISKRYKIEKIYLYLALTVAVLLIFLAFPHILDSI